jgi:hypothetical protein
MKTICNKSGGVRSSIRVVGKLLTFSASGVWFDAKQEIILEGLSQQIAYFLKDGRLRLDRRLC